MTHTTIESAIKAVAFALFCVAALCSATTGRAEDHIIFTANQGWLSRIYVLRMDGSVERFFEYEFYRFVDMEVVDNELYVSEAFAPRVYKVDIATGDLDVVIDDWSLYYFYGLAFDGTYLYVAEWDLNRYDIGGHYDSRASFDGDIFGSAWNGEYFWTLDDTNLIQCWDLSTWPTMTPVTELNFAPPSPECRGLWFDGEHYWSAESIEGALGYIYRFDAEGTVVEQWLAPGFQGWGACVIRDPAAHVGARLADGEPALRLVVEEGAGRGSDVGFAFHLERPGPVTLDVYDVRGARIALLFDGSLGRGDHLVVWDAQGVAAGVYFGRLRTGTRSISRKLLLIR
jgi:hypothetical protein